MLVNYLETFRYPTVTVSRASAAKPEHRGETINVTVGLSEWITIINMTADLTESSYMVNC